MEIEDRRILAAWRRREAIAEPLDQGARGRVIGVDVDALPFLERERPQVINAVGMVGMVMSIEHRVEPLDGGVKQLLAQIRRGVDQDASALTRAVCPLDQQRAAPAAVLRVVRIAVTPAKPDARYAGRRAAAQDGGAKRHAAVAASR